MKTAQDMHHTAKPKEKEEMRMSNGRNVRTQVFQDDLLTYFRARAVTQKALHLCACVLPGRSISFALSINNDCHLVDGRTLHSERLIRCISPP